MSAVLKAIVAALSAALVVLHVVLLSGHPITAADWQTVIDAAIGPILVYLVPNTTRVAVPATVPLVSDKTLIAPVQSSDLPVATQL